MQHNKLTSEIHNLERINLTSHEAQEMYIHIQIPGCYVDVCVVTH